MEEAKQHSKTTDDSVVSEKACDDDYAKLIAVLFSMESQWLRTSNVLAEQHAVQRDLEATRNLHLLHMKERKRRIVDVVEVVYQQMEFLTKNSYLDIEGDDDVASEVSIGTAFSFSEAENSVRQLDDSSNNHKILSQQSNLRERLAFLSAELDTLSIYLGTVTKAGDYNNLMPGDLRNVLNKLPKIPLPLSAMSCPPVVSHQQKQHLLRCISSATFQLPVKSRRFTLLSDKSLLLADYQCGMAEVCTESGRKFSRWLPPIYNADADEDFSWDLRYEDSVSGVTALSDGRAAVGLEFKKVVVLLRRCKKSQHDLDECEENLAWTEYRRLEPLPFSAHLLSGHGDVLAAGSLRIPAIQLMSIRSGRQLGPSIRCQYQIGSLAVCSNSIITGSNDKIVLRSGRLAYVIDAQSLTNPEKPLWRLTLSGDEELKALCADSVGGCLYIAVWASDRCRGRVAAFSLADGSQLRSFGLSLDAAPKSPLLLSALSVWNDVVTEPQPQQSGANVSRPMLLAVLYGDKDRQIDSTVTMFRISSGD